MRLAKNTQHDTSKVLQKYCACHTKRLSTRYKTRLNVTKCHTCHAKRSFCRTYHRHRHSNSADGCERLQTVGNGCGRLRTVANVKATSSEHTLSPRTPRMKREPLLRIRENPGDVGCIAVALSRPLGGKEVKPWPVYFEKTQQGRLVHPF